MYDIYYTTGGCPYTNAGSDKWVNDWLELVVPKLDVKPILLIHRNKPNNFDQIDYKFPIETYWYGDDIEKFEELCNGSEESIYFMDYYTPMKCIVDNKHKIHSNILHNSVDHILKATMGTDLKVVHASHIWISFGKRKLLNIVNIIYGLDYLIFLYLIKQLLITMSSKRIGSYQNQIQ